MRIGHHKSGFGASTSSGPEKRRLFVVLSLFALSFVIISARLITFSHRLEPTEVSEQTDSTPALKTRPDIVDRNGLLLATDIAIPSLYADPAKILDVDEVIEKISALFPSFDGSKFQNKLQDKKRRFVWLKRGLTPDQQAQVYDLGLPGIGFKLEPRRVYPAGRTAAHVLGYVDIDNKGLAGIEMYIDRVAGLYFPISQDPDNKTVIKLSMDLGAQHVLREELLGAIQKYKAKAAAGVVVDVISGEIIAMSSLPDFDPNLKHEVLEADRLDRLTDGSYELGSVFKAFTTAMALDLGVVSLDDSYDTREPIHIASFKIDDYHAKRRDLNISEIFIYSSNIGAARMAVDVGKERHRMFLKRVGLIDPIETELGGLRDPALPQHWGKVHSMTIAFGHGISVAPLQFATAASALVNGGYRIEPTFLYRTRDEGRKLAKKVLKSETSHIIRKLMRLNVVKGTGKRAAAKGYRVGGKTGTAEKVKGGTYSQNALLSTFLSLFPSDDPQYLMFVMIDEPTAAGSSGARPTAGLTAAPLTARIISRIAPILNVQPVQYRQAGFDENIPASY